MGQETEDQTPARAALRVFQDTSTTELVDNDNDKALAYEVNWSNFVVELTSGETLSGDLTLFYAGVATTTDPTSYVINNLSIAGVRTDANDDQSSFSVTTEASIKDTAPENPDSEFASLKGFLATQTNDGSSSDSSSGSNDEEPLLTLSRGESTINNETVILLDVVSRVNDFANRYRFYPTKSVRDRRDDDRDNDIRDQIIVNDVEVCQLNVDDNDVKTVASCQPKRRLLNRDNVEQVIDETLNQRWLSGELSVFNSDDGRRLVAQWPIESNSELGQACFNLTAEVFNDVSAINGRLDSQIKPGLRQLDLQTDMILSALTNDSPVRVSAAFNDVDPVNFAYRIFDNLSNDTVPNDLVINYRGDLIEEASSTMASRFVVEDENIQLRLFNDDSVIDLSANAPVFPFVYLLDKEGFNEACVTSIDALRDEPLVSLDQGVYIIQNQSTVYATVKRQPESDSDNSSNGSLVITFADGETTSL